ncbi:MAG: hypothetical protein HY578_06580 [Nitrospinae bacterium]|nr:hypothetical protein [Nitrospinota bacterium]
MDIKKITEGSLDNLREHLQKLIPALQITADSFRVKGEEEANKNYLICIEALQLFDELIDGIKRLFNIDFSKMLINGETIQSRKEKLLKLTSNMHSAQVNQDWITLADLLEYELTPLIEDWIYIIPSLQHEIKVIYQ